MAAPGTAEQRHLAWKALEAHYAEVGSATLKDLFAKASKRGERMTFCWTTAKTG